MCVEPQRFRDDFECATTFVSFGQLRPQVVTATVLSVTCVIRSEYELSRIISNVYIHITIFCV